MKLSYLDAGDWVCRYQRNNKRSGLKNLRCFPMCSDESHRLRGFCGRPAYVEVENPENKHLEAWACFTKLPKAGEKDPGMVPGTIITSNDVTENLRSKGNPFNPWIAGELEGTSPGDSFLTFAFNKQKRGWHYGWVANKHTCDMQHSLRTYVFEKIGGSEYRLLTFVDSPPFTIFCRRRQRQNLERLPAQLKKQLELQDMVKKSNMVMPRSITLEPDAPKVLDGSNVTKRKKQGRNISPKAKRRPNTSTKKKSELGIVAPRQLPIAPIICKPGIPPTTLEEKQHVLFHILRSLLRMEVKSNNSTGGIKQEPTGEKDRNAVDPLDSFLQDTFALPNSIRREDDFKPFQLDFSVLTGMSGAEDLKFGDLIKDFAYFLIEEEHFTNLIEENLSALGEDADPQKAKGIAVSVLVYLLTDFLKRYNVTIDELYHVFKTQVWDKKNTNKSVAKNVENRPLDTNKKTVKIEDAEKNFEQTVTYYQQTVNRSTQQSPRSVCDFGLTEQMFKITEEFVASSSDGFSTNIPHEDGRNDLSGFWVRPIETLNVLESIREKIGVPWILRKLLRFMEADLELSHGRTASGAPTLISQGNRKLLSSGYQVYILDGKDHPWSLPPPLPTERPATHLTYNGTLVNGKLTLALNYSKTKRLLRETVKEHENFLNSTVKFQFRDSETDEWVNKLSANCCATRKVGEETFDDVFKMDIDDELLWLTTPCNDTFALLS